jgi:hypothetical protein
MSELKTSVKPIRIRLINADDASLADHAPLRERFSSLASSVSDVYRERFGGSGGPTEAIALVAIISDFLQLMQNLDSQYGADNELPVNDASKAVDEALRCLAELDTWLDRLEKTDQREIVHMAQVGIGYWAMRHRLPFHAAEPIVNALAAQANRAETRQETAAIYALMQGFVQHLAPGLKADLERSNPERAWRLLNLNFAITAVRTGDAAMMRYAFDTLNAHLPDESAGFYEEAYALASRPGFPEETRALIEAEHSRWKRTH